VKRGNKLCYTKVPVEAINKVIGAYKMKRQMNVQPTKAIVECLSCDGIIRVGGNPKIGGIVTCDSCDESFEIIEIKPLMIDWLMYDDDYFDEDEYEY
jgi:transcription elongation factor Elf1